MTQPTPSAAAAPEDLRRELERARHLVEASYALHSTLDLDELLGLIMKAARDGVHADRGTVFLCTEDGTRLWSRVLSGDEHLHIELPLGQGIAGTVAATGKAIRLDDARNDSRFDSSWDEKSGFVTRQLLTAPIRGRDGKVVGVFQLLNRRDGAFDEHDEEYLAALSIHAALAVENAMLHRAALEKERQDREIRLVQSVQRAYQPERLEHAVGCLRAAGLNQLCEDASGDYYDIFERADGRLVVVVGDVSGHGLGAALVMAQARALVHAMADSVADLAELLALLNAHLARDMADGRFMTFFLAVADPATGRVEWNSAGHPPSLLYRAATGTIERLGPQGLVLGILPDVVYPPTPSLHLEEGDALLLYTDGATEARSAAHEMLEEEGLAAILGRLADRPAPALLEGIRDALVEWTGDEAFQDDLTLVALCRREDVAPG